MNSECEHLSMSEMGISGLSKFICNIILLILFWSCSSNSNQESAVGPVAYQIEMEEWQKKRIQDLRSENGWLNLAGLYWLKEGINTFGSGNKNDLVFPGGELPERAGFFVVNQGVVKMEVAPSVNITQGGSPVGSMVIFSPDSVSNPKLAYGSLQWFIIKRDQMVGVRLRDLQSETMKKFESIDRYSIDPTWRVEATLEQTPEPKMISITNILGQTIEEPSAGTLVFSIHEKQYTLDALEEGNELFIIFSDLTSEKETYPAGRYVYANKCGEDGKTVLDFNKAINPPCAFTPFATCLLPPKQNVLYLPVTAGEKKYSGYEHEK
jgi:uncharacterized protein